MTQTRYILETHDGLGPEAASDSPAIYGEVFYITDSGNMIAIGKTSLYFNRTEMKIAAKEIKTRHEESAQ